MEGRDSGSPKATQAPPPQHGHESHGTFSAFFRDPTGYPLMGSSPSIIHAPLAKRHSSSAQPFSVLSSPNSNPSPNPNPNPNLNSNVSPAGSTVVPNLNPNAIPNPNSGSPVYFGGLETPGASPSLALMVNLGERPSGEPLKKKRGRPRKYYKDENGVSVSISPSPLGPSSSSAPKKKPPSGKKAQLLALGAAGQYFTPHVLTVNAGEDVSTKIITFTSQGPWAVCILSANGAISNATLRHAGVSGGSVTYEGRFEILSLSGSFLLTENSGTRSRTGGLSVSLAGPDGHVIGGGVAGLLMAASPVQVVVGTFLTDIRKPVASNDESKPSGLGLVRPPVPAPMMHQVRMDVNSMQEHILGPSGEGEVQPRGFPSVPLQAMDCFANHFDAETRGNTEPQSASPAGP